MKVSGIITTYNEEHNIRDCINSLSWCEEILVVDSYSSDKTIEIASSMSKVRVLKREYYGSASQKNWAIDQAKHEWMLILDADERCTPELQAEILNLLLEPKYDAYTIRRKTYFLGKVIRFSGWQNNRVVRFLKKGGGRCPNLRAHGGIVPYKNAPMMKNPMIHYMVDDLKSYFDRQNKYAYWAASQMYLEGKKASPFIIFIHTFHRFLWSYFIQMGILDGSRGFVFCLGQSYGTYLKWSLLWGYRKKHDRKRTPVLPEFDEDMIWYHKSRKKIWIRTRQSFQALRFLFDKKD